MAGKAADPERQRRPRQLDARAARRRDRGQLGEIEVDDCPQRRQQAGIGLFKTGLIRRRGPWRSSEAVEFATLEWVDWSNHRRLLEPIGDIPPVEAEARYYAHIDGQARAA
jgi:putative transposase